MAAAISPPSLTFVSFPGRSASCWQPHRRNKLRLHWDRWCDRSVSVSARRGFCCGQWGTGCRSRDGQPPCQRPCGTACCAMLQCPALVCQSRGPKVTRARCRGDAVSDKYRHVPTYAKKRRRRRGGGLSFDKSDRTVCRQEMLVETSWTFWNFGSWLEPAGIDAPDSPERVLRSHSKIARQRYTQGGM